MATGGPFSNNLHSPPCPKLGTHLSWLIQPHPSETWVILYSSFSPIPYIQPIRKYCLFSLQNIHSPATSRHLLWDHSSFKTSISYLDYCYSHLNDLPVSTRACNLFSTWKYDLSKTNLNDIILIADHCSDFFQTEKKNKPMSLQWLISHIWFACFTPNPIISLTSNLPLLLCCIHLGLFTFSWTC